MAVKKATDDNSSISDMRKMVDRLNRRANKVAKAFVTPYPISSCVSGDDVKGEVLKYMFTCQGKILKGGIFLDHKPKKGLSVEIAVVNELTGSSKSYVVDRKSLLFEPKVEVTAWDRLAVSITPLDPTDKFTEVWTGFLWVPNIKEVDVKNFLINELENSK